MQEIKPIVAASKCLEFDACLADGSKAQAEIVRKLKPHVLFRPVCAECGIGLGAPRNPVRLVIEGDQRRLVQVGTGRDVTDSMIRFADDFLLSFPEVDGFILKSGSASCGIKDVKIFPAYDAPRAVKKGRGLFAAAVMQRFPGRPIEDEEGLQDRQTQEHFLTRLFTFARFRALAKNPSLAGLVKFHERNKLLLMAYSPKQARALERIVKNLNKLPSMEALLDYEDGLCRALAKPPRNLPVARALTSVMDSCKDAPPGEKQALLDLLDQFRKNKVPLASVLPVLKQWSLRSNAPELAAQTLFNRFPEGIVEETDQALKKKTSQQRTSAVPESNAGT
jgi:uncharacterized protein YbbK (DUF523 family)/uncharacterized protein YbgA (DUF1722 family)